MWERIKQLPLIRVVVAIALAVLVQMAVSKTGKFRRRAEKAERGQQQCLADGSRGALQDAELFNREGKGFRKDAKDAAEVAAKAHDRLAIHDVDHAAITNRWGAKRLRSKSGTTT